MDSRKIKFRVWCVKSKKFIEQPTRYERLAIGCNGGVYSGFYDVIDNDYLFQQYTGLKDKNAKEIYEGDIVIYRNKNREIRIGQYFNGEDERIGCFIQDPIFKHGNFGSGRVSNFEKCEVIGNIFENSELLKQ